MMRLIDYLGCLAVFAMLTLGAAVLVHGTIYAANEYHAAQESYRAANPLWYCTSDSVDVIGKDFTKCPKRRR
jgi:hypothetical protein